MRFVDNDEIDNGALAPPKRLRADDLRRRIEVGEFMLALQRADGVNAFGLEPLDRLIDQIQNRNDEGDSLSFVERHADDMRGQQRFSGAGRHLDHGAFVAGR